MRELSEIIESTRKELGHPKDFHVTRHFSSLVFISNGKVVKVTDPVIAGCPLAERFCPALQTARDTEEIKSIIKSYMEDKIARMSHFMYERGIINRKTAIPYGASEMIMNALKKGVIDSAVVVCEGAGTVVTDDPFVVQGIGARMNGIFYTTPISAVLERIKKQGAHIVDDNAKIDQAAGIELASRLGYIKIAVTICGYSEEKYNIIRGLEINLGIDITVLTVCTTGANKERIEEISDYSDLIWGCACKNIEDLLKNKVMRKTNTSIPIYVMSDKGNNLLTAYNNG